MSKLIGILSVAVLVLTLGAFVPNAQAGNITFVCGSTSDCGSQSVTLSAGNYSASGITEKEFFGPTPGTTFTLAFDTGASGDNVSLTFGGEILKGVIQSFSVSSAASTTLTLHVFWDVLPSDFALFLGSSTGDDSNAITMSVPSGAGAVTGVTTLILPTPEPISLALLGSGLLMVGGAVKRWHQK